MQGADLEKEQAVDFFDDAFNEIRRLRLAIEQGDYNEDELEQICDQIADMNNRYKPGETSKVFCLSRLKSE